MKIGTLAECHGMECSPHGVGNVLHQAAHLQCELAMPNSLFCEVPYSQGVRDQQPYVRGQIRITKDGYVEAPVAPGLGFEIDRAMLDKLTSRIEGSWKIPCARGNTFDDQYSYQVIACATVIEEMLPLLPKGSKPRFSISGCTSVRTGCGSTFRRLLTLQKGRPARSCSATVSVPMLCLATLEPLHPGGAAGGRLYRDLPWFPGRLPAPGEARAGHLLPDQGLDRSGRQSLRGVQAPRRALRQRTRSTHDQTHSQELHAARIYRHRRRKLEPYRGYARKAGAQFGLRYERWKAAQRSFAK